MKRRSAKVRAPTLSAPSTIRAFFLTPLIRELDRHGVEIGPVLREYGLSAAHLTSLYERVPLRNFVALAEDLAARFERPFLGLELGRNFTLADLGPFYAIFVLSGDLRSAVSGLARYQSIWQTNTMLDLTRGKDTSVLRYLILDPAIWPRRQDSEFALASFTALIRQLTSKRWRPVAVEFEHDVSSRMPALTQFFRAPVFGNRSANVLIMDNVELDQPLHSRLDGEDGNIAPILERHLLELLGPPAEVSQSFVSRVSRLMAKRLGRGEVTIDAVAAELSMSVRSLRRHLTEEGSSFRQILQQHRRTTIEAMLRGDGARLSDLAGRLSYSDGAVLSRAFKSWTGMSPREYAKAQRQD